jgi:uncharacterized membrane protein YoaK (UPF0700 family)
VLASVGGFVDVVGYLMLRHLFVAHMTGNTARFGVAVGHGHLGAAVPYVVAGCTFVVAIAGGTLLCENAGRTAVLVVEAGVLVALMAIGGMTQQPYYLLVVLAVAAMGLQAAALTRVGDQRVRTTYISGLLTNMTQAAVARDMARARLLAAVFVCFVGGGVAGSFGQHLARAWALALPVAALLACVAISGVDAQRS